MISKTYAPLETLFIDLSQHKDKIDFDNCSNESLILGWAKLEKIGDTIYRVYNQFNNKVPNAYILTFKPL